MALRCRSLAARRAPCGDRGRVHGEGRVARGGGVLGAELDDRHGAAEDDDALALFFGAHVDELALLDEALERLAGRAARASADWPPSGTRMVKTVRSWSRTVPPLALGEALAAGGGV